MENKRISSAPLIRKKYDIKELPSHKLNDNNLFLNEQEKIKLERNINSAQILNNNVYNKDKKLLYNNNHGRSLSGNVINENNNNGGVVERLRSASSRLPLQTISNQAIEITNQVLYGTGLKNAKGNDDKYIKKNRHKSPLHLLIKDKNDKEIEKNALDLINYLIGNNNNDIEKNNDKNIDLFLSKKINNSNSNKCKEILLNEDKNDNNSNNKIEIITNDDKIFSNNNKRINSAIKKPNSAHIASNNKLNSLLQETENKFNVYNDDNDFVNEDDNDDDNVDGDVDNAISKYAKEGRVYRPLTSKIRDLNNIPKTTFNDNNDNNDVVNKTKRALSAIQKPNSAPLITSNNKLAPHLQEVKDYLYAKENNISIPMISQISPRTLRKISVLPPSNEKEINAINSILIKAKAVKPLIIYDRITKASDISNEKLHHPTLTGKQNHLSVQVSINRPNSACASPTPNKEYFNNNLSKRPFSASPTLINSNNLSPTPSTKTLSTSRVRSPSPKKISKGRSPPIYNIGQSRPPLPPRKQSPSLNESQKLTDLVINVDDVSNNEIIKKEIKENIVNIVIKEEIKENIILNQFESKPIPKSTIRPVSSILSPSPAMVKSTENRPESSIEIRSDIRPKSAFNSNIITNSEKINLDESSAEFYRKYERKLKRREDRKKIEELQYKNEQLFANNVQSPTKISPITTIINKDFENIVFKQSAKNNELRCKSATKSIITKPKIKFIDEFKASIFDDLGINLDPAFNKFRKNKLGLETIIFYVNSFKLEESFDWFKLQVAKATAGRIKSASLLLTRIAYGYLSRKRVNKIKLNIAEILWKETQYIRDREKLVAEKSYIITSYFRCRIRRKALNLMILKRSCATLIQIRIRIYLARCKLIQLRLILKNKIIASTRIQCFYRQRLAIKKVKVYRKIINVTHLLEANEVNDKLKLVKYLKKGAQESIGRFYKAYKIRCRLKVIIFWHHQELITMIQKIYRGYVLRKSFLPKIRKIKRGRSRLHKAAIKIQKLVRVRQALLRYNELYKISYEKKKAYLKEKHRLIKFYHVEFLDVNYGNASPFRFARKLFRKLFPFRHIFEKFKAIKIQRVYRGYRGRRRRLRLILENFVAKMEWYENRKAFLICWLQRQTRGMLSRKDQLKIKRNFASIKIQSVFRGHLGRKYVSKMYASVIAGIRLTKWARYHLRRKFWCRISAQNKKVRVHVIKIQNVVRNYLNRCFVSRWTTFLRLQAEFKATVDYPITKLIHGIECKILLESLNRDIGIEFKREAQKNSKLKDLKCPCIGPVQALFVSLCNNARYDKDELPTNKLDVSSFVNYGVKVKGLMDVAGFGLASKITVESKLSDHLKERTEDHNDAIAQRDVTLPLIESISTGFTKLPNRPKQLSKSDLEVAFTKGKTDKTSGNYLSYFEFVEALRYLSKSHYPTIKVRKDTTSWLEIQIKKGQQDSDGKSSNANRKLHSPSKSSPSSSDNIDFSPEKIKKTKKSIFEIRQNITILTEQFKVSQEQDNLKSADLRLCAIVLQFFSLASSRKERWCLDVIEWMSLEARNRLYKYVYLIQKLYRGYHMRKMARHFYLNRQEMKEYQLKFKLARLIQVRVKMFLCRRFVAHLAQKKMYHYIPVDTPEYWYNPVTRFVMYKKPKCLLDYDAVVISLPSKGMEFISKCQLCNDKAVLNCVQCEESFCEVCYESLHCKGSRKRHQKIKIPYCPNCTFQQASKICQTCVLHKPIPGSKQEAMLQTERGIFCDTCFQCIHDSEFETRSADELVKSRLSEKYICSHSKDLYQIRQHLRQEVITTHKHDNLIQPCEECNWRAASWRCIECEQIYCNKCLQGLHSIPGSVFTKHRAEPLPYYTPEMHKKYKKDFSSLKFCKQMSVIKEKWQAEYVIFQAKSIIKLQTWWRQIYYCRIGKLAMKRKRKYNILQWKKRKIDDKNIRSKWFYKLKDIFGFSEVLRTDTKEELVLQRIPIFFREEARQFIYKNKSDWAFYKELKDNEEELNQENLLKKKMNSLMPLSIKQDENAELLSIKGKGVPLTGFSIGSIEELQEQARYGGSRRPGAVKVKYGERTHPTKTSLVGIVFKGELVRIRSHIFGCVGVSHESITLDRCWRKITNDEDDNEWDILYRLPRNIKFVFKYKLYNWIIGNPLSQALFKTYFQFYSKLGDLGAYMKDIAIAEENIEESKEWENLVNFSDSKVKWVNIFINEGYENTLDEVAENGDPDELPGNGFDELDELDKELDGNVGDKKAQKKKRKKKTIVSENVTAADVAGMTKDEINDAIIAARVPGKEWKATRMELEERKEIEKKMSIEELYVVADTWGEAQIDVLTTLIYYVNKDTKEVFSGVPYSVMSKQIDMELKAQQKEQYEKANLALHKVVPKVKKGMSGRNK